MAESDEEAEVAFNLFQEPDGFYQKEKEPSQVQHQTLSGETLVLHLVGSSPLWGHLLWQAGRVVADYLENHKSELIQDKTILELGAGAGLPGLIGAINGAKQVVLTDYPDVDLVDNLRLNIRDCSLLPRPFNIVADGYLWGADSSTLKAHLPTGEQVAGFDVLILADLLFNHSEHGKLLLSIQQTLKKDARAQALVFFTPYRPWLFKKDMAFFDLARDGGFLVEKVLEHVMDKVMFKEDPGVCVPPHTETMARCICADKTVRMNCFEELCSAISCDGRNRLLRPDDHSHSD